MLTFCSRPATRTGNAEDRDEVDEGLDDLGRGSRGPAVRPGEAGTALLAGARLDVVAGRGISLLAVTFA